MKGLPFRVLPAVSEQTAGFWQGGRDGELRILRCRSCGYWIHPPSPRCPACLDTDVAPDTTSGRATVFSVTVNHQAWVPGSEPYAIALVELPEQEGLRLTTNVVGCAPEEVRIGMPVTVTFEEHDEVWLPLFRPEQA